MFAKIIPAIERLVDKYSLVCDEIIPLLKSSNEMVQKVQTMVDAGLAQMELQVKNSEDADESLRRKIRKDPRFAEFEYSSPAEIYRKVAEAEKALHTMKHGKKSKYDYDDDVEPASPEATAKFEKYLISLKKRFEEYCEFMT